MINTMINIPLTKGLSAIVDDDDDNLLKDFSWHACGKKGHEYGATRKRKTQEFIYMHHMIAGRPPSGFVTDHINGNTLDNRKSNLRFVTVAQNVYNKRKQKSGRTSKFKGVYWAAHASMWRVRVAVDRKIFEIGYFKVELDAARAYDEAAKLHHGQWARINDV
jgi:HNH endonuclease